jgi:hypothetical protein
MWDRKGFGPNLEACLVGVSAEACLRPSEAGPTTSLDRWNMERHWCVVGHDWQPVDAHYYHGSQNSLS